MLRTRALAEVDARFQAVEARYKTNYDLTRGEVETFAPGQKVLVYLSVR